MSDRDALAGLRALAAAKGYRVERALMRKCWRLVDEATGEAAKRETGSTAFTTAQATKFLKNRP